MKPTKRRRHGRAINPLPSFLRASAWDAADRQKRKAWREAWNEDDHALACETLERLVRACYGKPGENQPDMCFIRFGVAEAWEKAGHLSLESDWGEVLAAIDDALNTPIGERLDETH